MFAQDYPARSIRFVVPSPAGSGIDTMSRLMMPAFSGCERKAVEAGLFSKGLEFEIFKIRVVDLLPDANQFKGIAIAHPVVDQRIVGKFFRHVGERNEVVVAARHDGDGSSLNLDGAFSGFAHKVRPSA